MTMKKERVFSINEIQKAVVECFGTAILLFIGTGTAVLSGGDVSIALAFGLTLIVLIYTLGSYSGAHFNPAVSLAFYLTKRLPLNSFILYLVAQLSGAAIGSGVLLLTLKMAGMEQGNLGQNSTATIGLSAAFFIEVILTACFVSVILKITTEPNYQLISGLIIGLTLIALILMALPLTGASFNPARSFGPAIWLGGDSLKMLPTFIVAPLLGGALAAYFAKK